MKRRAMISLLSGVIVIAATLLISMILRPALRPSTIIGMCFLLYSEVVFFGWIPLVDHFALKEKTPFAWSGIGVTVSLYAAVVFVSAILYMAGSHIRAFLILQIVLLAAAAVLCLVIESFSAKIEKDSQALRQAEMGNQILLEKLADVKGQVRNKTEIEQLIESVRYADVSVTVQADMELHQAVVDLQKLISAGMAETPAFDTALRNIKSLINKREAQARISKSGEI